jgi:hypothetical protein
MPSPWLMKAGTAAAPAEFDRAAVARAAQILFDPDAGVQIQSLPSGRWAVHRGGDVAGIRATVEKFSDEKGVYWSLNPCPLDQAKPITAPVMLNRRWLLIDLDTERPDETNANESEKDAARDVAAKVLDELAGEGWPPPVIVDSGNGWHLLYRIDLPNDAESRTMCKDALTALMGRYQTAAVKFDTKVFNANRISKLPGTWARKGPHTDERPHRLAKFLSVPEKVEVVRRELLAALAATASAAAKPLPEPARGPVWRVRGGAAEGDEYDTRAIQNECQRIVMAPVGDRNNTVNDAAFRLGTLCAGNILLRQRCERELTMAAFESGLLHTEGDKTADTIKRALDDGEKHPRKPRPEPSKNGKHPEPAGQKPKDVEWELQLDGEVIASGKPDSWLKDASGLWSGARQREEYELHTLSGLMSNDYPPVRWVVPGLICDGLNILAGKPKLGKSMFALNIAITVAGGGKALGDIQTTPGEVLYLALEDRAVRLQGRARKMLQGLDAKVSRRLKIATRWPRQDRGGLDLMAHWARNLCEDKPALCIIDVWTKFRTPSQAKGNAYEQDYDAMSQVKSVADELGFAVQVVHHCRKSQGQDVLEEIGGTMGLSGSADGILALTRARNESEATIFVTGRDVDEKEISLKFDAKTLTWQSQGDAKDRNASKVKSAILAAFQATPGASFMPSQLADLLGMDRAAVKLALWRMEKDGQLKRVGSKYGWPVGELHEDIEVI